MRDRRQHLIVLWEWAHSQYSPSSLDGPTRDIRPLLLDGPTWAFTRSSVKMHMGSNGYYDKYLLHYVVNRP
jgi:hypothetical protein